MKPKRGASGLSGIMLVDKPAGLTSHDVVARVRRVSGEGRVGHAGTLDPMATGLLVMLVGSATRLTPYLTSAEKSYRARVVFGSETDTDDAEGQVVTSADVPGALTDHAYAESVVAGLVGTHEQVPPAYSAIKKDGVVSYRAARAGSEVVLEPRSIEVSSSLLTRVVAGPPVAWDLDLTVSKGTYVRAVARDLGRACGTAAHLGALRRLSSGLLSVSDAVQLASLESPSDVVAAFVDPVAALGFARVDVDPSDAADGKSLFGDVVASVSDGDLVSVTDRVRLLSLYRRADGRLVPEVVLAGGVAGVKP